MDTSTNKEIYYFNPGHENAILNASPHYMAPANMICMQKDLAYLSAWYANPSDYVLIDRELPLNFKEYLSIHIQPIAEGITTKELIHKTTNCKAHLWGISPQSIYFFESLNTQYNLNLQIPSWNNQITALSSRETAKECLELLIEKNSAISPSILPIFYHNLEDIEQKVLSTNYQFISKAPYSSSGRGLLWLPVEGLTRTEKQIIHGILKKQGKISIEKALDRKLDFAMEFYLSDSRVCNFVGYSLFDTTNRGAYLGNYIGSQTNILNKISSYIDSALLENIQEQLITYLELKFGGIYTGCIGVDMMIYRENYTCHLHPCIEINVRDNMGLIALEIYKNYIIPNSEGYFHIDFSKKEGEISNRDQEMRKTYPTIFEDGKIKSGYLSLCPILPDSRYRAYILIN